jgi:hypothetical protein
MCAALMELLRGLLCPAVHQLVGLSVTSVLYFSLVDMAFATINAF